jgi:hypothetical protein
MRRTFALIALVIGSAFAAYVLIGWKSEPRAHATAERAQIKALIYKPIVDSTRPVDDKIAEVIRALEPRAPMAKPAEDITGSVPQPAGPVVTKDKRKGAREPR